MSGKKRIYLPRLRAPWITPTACHSTKEKALQRTQDLLRSGKARKTQIPPALICGNLQQPRNVQRPASWPDRLIGNRLHHLLSLDLTGAEMLRELLRRPSFASDVRLSKASG